MKKNAIVDKTTETQVFQILKYIIIKCKILDK